MAVQASPTVPDNNPAATAAANATAFGNQTAVDSSGKAITGFGSASPTQPTPPNFNSINGTNLTPTTPVILPPPPTPSTTGANGLVAAGSQTSKSVQDYIDQLTPPPTALDQTQSSILASISQLTGQDTGKDQALKDAQDASGATQDQKDLTSLNNQLLTQTAQYNQEQANLGGNGSVETKAVLAAQNAGLAKARAADIGLTTAQIQAKQGNLTLAMNTASQAVDAKYSTIEDNIKTAQAQLAAIAPLLTKEQSTQAEAQKQVLQDQADAVAQKKADETQINNVALEAAKAGASSDVISSIMGSADPIAAIAAAAPALGAAATQKLQQDAFDNNIKLQQLMISKANLGLAEQKQASEMNPANLIAYAQQYASTGTLPSGAPTGTAGAIAQVAASLPKAPGTIYDGNTGVAPSKLSATQETSITGLYNIINNILPQLSGNYTNNSATGQISSVADYNDTFNNLKDALTALNSAGVLKGDANTYLSQVPDASHWYSSGVYTVSGKNQISTLTDTLKQQLNSYLNTNNLKVSGFNDTSSQTGVNSPNSLSQFLTK